jgi:hypothetical protein
VLGGVGGVICLWNWRIAACLWATPNVNCGEATRRGISSTAAQQPTTDPEHLGEHCPANRRGSIQTVAHNADIVLIKFPC